MRGYDVISAHTELGAGAACVQGPEELPLLNGQDVPVRFHDGDVVAKRSVNMLKRQH